VAGYAGSDAAEAVEALLAARAQARKEKNWAVADGVRNGLNDLGFVIEDTPQGAKVSYKQ
jgi:cysteinyl-tRNA synthetase